MIGRIGDILRQKFDLDNQAIEDAARIQAEKGGRFGEILCRQKNISEDKLLRVLGEQFDMEVYPVLPRDFSTEFTKKVPIKHLKNYLCVPICSEDDCFIAANDPLFYQQIDDLRRKIGMLGAKIVLSPKSAILSVINDAYNIDKDSEAAAQVIQDMGEEDPEKIISAIEASSDLLDDTSDAPVIKFVNLMFTQAIQDGASDIHIEPYKNTLKIRERLDGILYDMFVPPVHIHAALISRIKVLANLNIAEKRLPQDGRIGIVIGNKEVDIRVSTLPTPYGERGVLRFLHRASVMVDLDNLGMPPKLLTTFNSHISASHGIILVTGPTGSGKTTTLYAALSSLNSTALNIITVEDPIEYRIDGIGQVQVNQKIGLTFAKGLRSIVRQDPDVILIGEIRDRETAEIAIQSALTGHLVFSTLHTNDSASAVTRLINMGIESFLVTSAVNAILAQRLVRILCPVCRQGYIPDLESVQYIGLTSDMFADSEIYKAVGCSECLQTGFKGRSAIFEFMVMDEALKKIIIKTSDANAIKETAVSGGLVTLLSDGIKKIKAGLTTIEEVYRVTQQ